MANIRTSDLILEILARTADGCLNITDGIIGAFQLRESKGDDSLTRMVSENALRSALKRLKQKGCLERVEKGGQVSYIITEVGRNKIDKLLFDRDVWDGQWRVVMFDIPENKKKVRDNFRVVLRASGFKHFQKSVWITPFDVMDEVEDFVEDHDLHDNIWYFISKSIKNDEELIERFLNKEIQISIN